MSRFVNLEDLLEWMGAMDDIETAVTFLMGERLLPSSIKCLYCESVLFPKYSERKKYPVFTCRKGQHYFTQSILKGTWFEGTHLQLRQVMNLCLCFSVQMPYSMVEIFASFGNHKISTKSISDWYSFCREICWKGIMRRMGIAGKIGGPGRIIQIDECKIDGHKELGGRIVKGKQVLAMFDQENKDLRVEICPENRRDADTLFDLIDKHVDRASTIITDCWRGYNGPMGDEFAKHLTDNQTYNFVDSTTNGHTNTIRQRLSCDGITQEKLALYLDEHLWMTDCRKRDVEPFVQLIDDIRWHYPFE